MPASLSMDYQISETEYRDSLKWLFSQLPMFSRIGQAAYKPGLDNTVALDSLYGYPHRKYKTIHVGGTNGKGSTSHMLASVFQKAGYKTGLYTSPHLVDFRERIKINGEMIPQEAVTSFVNDWKKKETELNPSFFELTMMMAFNWFSKEKVDVAIIEVGMGGRLDSTNVITPDLSIITNISFDHTAFLGNTLKRIAMEKAGIIKPGIPVVIGETDEETKEVFSKKAMECESKILFAEQFDQIASTNHNSEGWAFNMISGEEYFIPMPGLYQEKNIRTILTAIDELNRIGYKITKENIKDGLKNVQELTGLRGRWQLTRKHPDIVCDTGHNEAGIREAMKTLKTIYPDKKIKFVIGFVNDKDVEKIINYFPKDADYYFTKADIPRAMSEETVASYFSNKGIVGSTYLKVADAVTAALKDSNENSIIYVGGSTFIVADYLAAFAEDSVED